MRGLRYPVVVVIVVVVLGILFAGQRLYTKLVLEKPVVDALDLPYVISSRYEENSNTVEVELKEVENLKKVYLEIEKRLSSYEDSKKGDLKIEIIDRRSDVLEKAFYESSFAVHQAIIRGDFISMHDYISRVAKNNGLDKFFIFIDNRNVYVQMHKDGKYLYEVVSREVPGKS